MYHYVSYWFLLLVQFEEMYWYTFENFLKNLRIAKKISIIYLTLLISPSITASKATAVAIPNHAQYTNMGGVYICGYGYRFLPCTIHVDIVRKLPPANPGVAGFVPFLNCIVISLCCNLLYNKMVSGRQRTAAVW